LATLVWKKTRIKELELRTIMKEDYNEGPEGRKAMWLTNGGGGGEGGVDRLVLDCLYSAGVPSFGTKLDLWYLLLSKQKIKYKNKI